MLMPRIILATDMHFQCLSLKKISRDWPIEEFSGHICRPMCLLLVFSVAKFISNFSKSTYEQPSTGWGRYVRGYIVFHNEECYETIKTSFSLFYRATGILQIQTCESGRERKVKVYLCKRRPLLLSSECSFTPLPPGYSTLSWSPTSAAPYLVRLDSRWPHPLLPGVDRFPPSRGPGHYHQPPALFSP